MAKFILPGFLLVLLASLMKPTLPTADSESQSSVQKPKSFIAVGKSIQNARLARGLSSDDLAYMINLTNFEIEKIEANEVVPSKELIGKINVALKTKIYTEK